MTTKPTPEPEPEPRRPARSDEHDPLHPDHAPHPGHKLPDHARPDATPPPHTPPAPQPKSGRAARDASVPATALTALLPSSANIGDPSFTVRVVGSGFTPTSVIVFAGQEEPTAFVTDAELTTGVNMAMWLGPDPAIPVLVRTTIDGVPEETSTLFFVFGEPRPVPLDEAHASKPIPLMDLITRV